MGNSRIKFRAWSTKHKKWYDNFLISENGLNVYIGYATDRVDAMLSQYTGLLDKNGKEIYEGDIVRSRTDCGCGSPECKDRTLEEEVYFAEGAFYPICTIPEKERYYEVVGNIYENPELLG